MTVKTNNEMIGELTREVDQLRGLIAAYSEPLKVKIKQKEHAISRLLLEDGRQQVDLTLLDSNDDD